MSARAKRPTRKELRQPDEFVTATGKAVEWAKQNQTTVKYAGAALVAVLLATVAVSWWVSSRNASANQQFYAAIELYKAEQWAEAFDGFRALADDLGSTDYGHLARLYAARAALKLEKPAEAATLYREYLAGSTTPALEQLARLNLARALEATGDGAGAREQLEAAMKISGPAGPEVVLEFARSEAANGAEDRARELYARYLEENPDGPGKDLARARLVALGGTPPAAPRSGFPAGVNPLQVQVR